MPVADARVEDRLLSVREASVIIGAGYSTTKSLIRTGELASIKRGRRRLVLWSATQEHIRRLVQQPAA